LIETHLSYVVAKLSKPEHEIFLLESNTTYGGGTI